MEKGIEAYLKEKEQEGLLRGLTGVKNAGGGIIFVNGKKYVNFSSNDYLGLSNHPAIKKAVQETASAYVGSSASRLMTGNTEYHERLETKTAEFTQKPAALIFNSGYQANVGTISALLGKGDVIFSDRLNHASIVDGMVLSRAAFFRFKHNDMEHLAELLDKHRKKYKKALIVTESVFSMEGDIAPLERLIALKKEHDSLLMTDEAHATGIYGPCGNGILGEKKLLNDCDIVMGTFGKAMGVFGAYVASSEAIKKYLINTARSFIYSTALPVPIVNANIAAIEVVRKEKGRREALISNAAYFRGLLSANGIKCAGETQIVPVITGEAERTIRVSDELRKKGYWVTPIRPPTVPRGLSRVRISVTYDHKRDVLKKFARDITVVLSGQK